MNIQPKPILVFAFKFLLFYPIIWIPWWQFLPHYAWLIAQIAGSLIANLGGISIEALAVDSADSTFLNSGTSIIYTSQGRQMPFDIASLVANLPPFLILIFATPKLKLRPAIRALLIGVPIIAAGHISFISAAFILNKQIAKTPEVPTGIGYVFVALPFLLWIMLIQWQNISQYITTAQPPSPAEPEKAPPQKD